METVEFRDVEVLGEAGAELLCLIAGQRVEVPLLLLQSGTAVRRCGDRGTVVLPRWLGIGLGLVWPFVPEAGRPILEEQDARARGAALQAVLEQRRRPPRRVAQRDPGPARRVNGGSS
jgi:hypothetical protein